MRIQFKEQVKPQSIQYSQVILFLTHKIFECKKTKEKTQIEFH